MRNFWVNSGMNFWKNSRWNFLKNSQSHIWINFLRKFRRVNKIRVYNLKKIKEYSQKAFRRKFWKHFQYYPEGAVLWKNFSGTFDKIPRSLFGGNSRGTSKRLPGTFGKKKSGKIVGGIPDGIFNRISKDILRRVSGQKEVFLKEHSKKSSKNSKVNFWTNYRRSYYGRKIIGRSCEKLGKELK